MNLENALSILEEKLILDIDYNFIPRLKLPYHNIYYLVCFIEVLHRFITDEKYFSTINEAVENINIHAVKLYNGRDISSVFQSYFEYHER